jgi:PAS domain S-box-containing protein
VGSVRPATAVERAADGTVDCLVVDRRVEGDASGVELAERVRDATDGVAVVLVVGGDACADGAGEEAADDVLAAGIEAGVDDWLPRSLATDRPELVAERIARTVRRAGGDGGRGREREYEQIFQSVNDAVAVHDIETGELVEVNERLCELTGYDREQLLDLGTEGVTVATDEFGPEDVREVVERVAAGEDVDPYEQAIRTTDGERRWLEVNATRAEIGGEERFLAIARDVTERRRRERALEESEQRFREIAEALDQVIYLATPDMEELEYLSPGYEEIWGRPPAEMDEDPTSFIEGIHPADRDGYVDRMERMREALTTAGGRDAADVYEFEYRVVRPDGEVRWVDATAYPIRDADGTVRRLAGVIDDVTERREREDALDSLHAATRELMQASTPEAVADVTVEAAEGVLGFSINGVRLVEGDWPPDEGDGHDEPVLRPVRTSERTTEVIGERPVYDYGESVHWDVLASGEPAEFDAVTAIDDEVDRPPVGSLLYLPLGDHGVLSVGRDAEGGFDATDRRLARLLAANAAVALDRVAREREVRERERRLRLIAERIDEAVSLTTPDLSAATYLSSGYGELLGRPVAELGDDPLSLLEAVHPEDRDALRAGLESMVGETTDPSVDAADSYAFEYRIVRPAGADGDGEDGDADAGPADATAGVGGVADVDGEVRWVHTDCYPARATDDGIGHGDGGDTDGSTDAAGPVDRLVVVSRDVTDRRARERRIASFDEATDDLATADDPRTAARRAVEAAVETLELPAVALYLYDDGAGVLEPAALSPSLSAAVDDPDAVGPGESPVWQAFAGDTALTVADGGVDASASAVDPAALSLDVDLSSAHLLPLGTHGVMLVGLPDGGGGDVDAGRLEAAHLLAATLEAALNHLRGRRRLEAREAELESYAERAERLDRIARLTRRVEAAITAASTREEVHRAVAERLVEAGGYEAAWLGDVEVGGERLTPRAVAGVDASDVGGVAVASGEADPEPDPHPAAAAYRTGEVQVADSLVGDGPAAGWRRGLLRRGVQSVCAVPVVDGDVVRGVLVVCAGTPRAFDDRERDVLAQLGRSIGYALTAMERRRALESDDTVELEFAGEHAGLAPARLARAAGCRVRHERTVRRQSGRVAVYYTLAGDVPEDPAAVTARTFAGDVTVVSSDASGTLVEVTGDTWFGSPLADYGAVLRHARATPGECTLVVELPAGADVRSFVDRLRDRHPGLELVAQRRHQQSDRTPVELRALLRERLTDRQHEALSTAYAAGYFEWPRDASGEAVAERLDITQPTFNKHLRLAERTAFELLLDEDA